MSKVESMPPARSSEIATSSGHAEQSEGTTTKLQNAVQGVTPAEQRSIHGQSNQRDEQAHQNSIAEINQGHLTIPALFSDAASSVWQNQRQVWGDIGNGDASIGECVEGGLEITAAAGVGIAAVELTVPAAVLAAVGDSLYGFSSVMAAPITGMLSGI